jgi:four helix bundle protein
MSKSNSMPVKRWAHFKELNAYKHSMELAVSVYKFTNKLSEIYPNLADQIQRATVSVFSNMAEGYGQNTLRNYRRFLSMAVGSLFEITAQLYFCANLELLPSEHEIFTLLSKTEKELSTLWEEINSQIPLSK